MRRDAGDVDLRRLDPPVQLAAEDVDRNRAADVRRGGHHRRGLDQRGDLLGHRVGAADMAREHRNDELAGIVDHRHAGIDVLVLQVRCDQSHHGTERDEEDQLVEALEQRRDLVAQRALIGAHRIGHLCEGAGELGRGADRRLRQPACQCRGLRGAVLRDGDDADARIDSGNGRDSAHAATPGEVFFRQPRMRSPRTRCGLRTIISER